MLKTLGASIVAAAIPAHACVASYYWQPQRVASGGWFNPNKGSYMFLQDDLWDQACDNRFDHNVTVVAAVLYWLTPLELVGTEGRAIWRAGVQRFQTGLLQNLPLRLVQAVAGT